MKILENLADKIRKIGAKPEEKNELSSGYWPDRVRTKAFEICKDRKGKLLEIGCGEGLFLKLFADNKNIELFGVDSDDKRLDGARSRLTIKAKLNIGDAKNLFYENGFFDIIVCINMLYNLKGLDDVENIISEVRRVCKNGGTLVVDIRNKLNPLVNLKYKFAKFYDSTITHPLQTHLPHQIFGLLKRNGFEIIRRVPIGFSFWLFAPVIVIEAKKEG